MKPPLPLLQEFRKHRDLKLSWPESLSGCNFNETVRILRSSASLSYADFPTLHFSTAKTETVVLVRLKYALTVRGRGTVFRHYYCSLAASAGQV
jgi:hypothetical protein